MQPDLTVSQEVALRLLENVAAMRPFADVASDDPELDRRYLAEAQRAEAIARGLLGDALVDKVFEESGR